MNAHIHEPRPATTFFDVIDVVSLKTNDQLPMVVGGHAVNIWALAFSSRLEFGLFASFTTKDLDETIISPKARLVTRKWGIDFDEVMPKEAILRRELEKIKNFARYRMDLSPGKIREIT